MKKVIKSYFGQDCGRLEDIYVLNIPHSFCNNWKETIKTVSKFLVNVQCNYGNDLVKGFYDDDDKDSYNGLITKDFIEKNKDYIGHCVDCMGSCLERTLDFIENLISDAWSYTVISIDETYDTDYNEFD